MRISIIIRTKDEEKSIGQVLENISAQRQDCAVETVIVDSGSTDRTLDIVQKYNVKLLNIPPEKFTFGYALNQGVRHASGDIICCLSAHCIPADNHWLSELVRQILEGKAHATYGRQVPIKGLNPFEEAFLGRKFPERAEASGRVAFSNANCAFLKTMWQEVPFDENISGWEDYLWYLLLKNRFVFRYAPVAGVFHSHPFSLKRMAMTAYRDGQALRYIKDAYHYDIAGEKFATGSKFLYIIHDMSDHIRDFYAKGHMRYALLLPFLKLCIYFNFWRGYHSSGGCVTYGALR